MQRLHTFFLVFSQVHARICSPAGWQDIVMLSDRQITSRYSTLRQREMTIVWQWSIMFSTVTPCIHERWLALSLKQSHYKADMTSVTLAIITGQDSWPLPVTVHVEIRITRLSDWLWSPGAKAVLKCFLLNQTVRPFSVAANCLVCFSSRGKQKSDSRVFRVCDSSMPPLVQCPPKMPKLLYVSTDVASYGLG